MTIDTRRPTAFLSALALLSLGLGGAAKAQAQDQSGALPMREAVRAVAPGLERYGVEALHGRLWQRPDLSPRDRSLVTVAALVARNQSAGMTAHLDLALENGVRPGEISELITHLSFYSGWGNAVTAVTAARDVFARRGIGPEQLSPASPELLPLDEATEAQRAARVRQDVGPIVPGLEQFTTDVLFRDLWLRPGLAPRDRSLVTVTALIAGGQVAQIPFHLSRAMDNGLTRAQAAEVVTHLAFYAGWPNAFSAVPLVRSVFEARRG